MSARNESNYNARQDANDFPTVTGVAGTIGTGAAIGTADIVNIGVNPATGAMYVEPTTASPMNSGTISTIVAGTLNTLGTVGTVEGVGTVSNLGSLNTVTTVSNLTNGSVRMTVGTLTTGTLQNLASGTINALASGTITAGTVTVAVGTITTGSLTNIANLLNGTTVQPSGTVTTQAAGTLNTLGTVGVVNSVAAGTQQTLGTVGVVNSIVAGTQNTLGTVGIVNSQVTSTFDHGSNRDVDTAAEQITTSSITAKFGVVVKAASSNTGIIYVGNSDVTAGTTDATDGFELLAGESVTVKVNNANLVYVIASANNQIIYWMTV